jgi:AraC family transcriptional regulator
MPRGDEDDRPRDIPLWVSGTPTVQSPTTGWDGVSVAGFQYPGSDVAVPAISDYLVVAYRRGVTDMHRRFDSGWTHADLVPGDVSLLTRAAESHWRWSNPIEVVHVYLSVAAIESVCTQVFERDIADIELRDLLKANDPAVYQATIMLATEAASGELGSRLLVESLSTQLIVRLLRSHAHTTFRDQPLLGALNYLQLRMVRDYVDAHIGQNMSLPDLAGLVSLSPYHFARQFKSAQGCSPHEYVLQQRVEHAQRLLWRTRLPIRDIAIDTGFYDQAHMTRVFTRRLGITPRQYRLAA